MKGHCGRSAPRKAVQTGSLSDGLLEYLDLSTFLEIPITDASEQTPAEDA